MREIHLTPFDAWDFFQKNKANLTKNVVVIATSGDFEVAMTEKFGYPNIIMYCCDAQILERSAHCMFDLEDIITESYDEIFGKGWEDFLEDDSLPDDDDCPPEDIEDIMALREEEIMDAYKYFLSVLLDCGNSEISAIESKDKSVSTSLEEVLDVIGLSHGFKILRPMYIEWEDGHESVEEYPYQIDASFENESKGE